MYGMITTMVVLAVAFLSIPGWWKQTSSLLPLWATVLDAVITLAVVWYVILNGVLRLKEIYGRHFDSAKQLTEAEKERLSRTYPKICYLAAALIAVWIPSQVAPSWQLLLGVIFLLGLGLKLQVESLTNREERT